MSDLYVSWDDYHQNIEKLAIQIYESGWQFNQILCLAKGGLRINNQVRGAITFSHELTMTTANLGSHVLLVDDLVDSGISLKKSLLWLDRKYGYYIEEVRSAVLWYKASSIIKPDYYVDYLEDNPWIHQPFEPYEQMSVADLVENRKG
jgi:uncharacterized protein